MAQDIISNEEYHIKRR